MVTHPDFHTKSALHGNCDVPLGPNPPILLPNCAYCARLEVSTFHWCLSARNLSLNFFGTHCVQVLNFPSYSNVRNTHGSVGNLHFELIAVERPLNCNIPPPPLEPCASHMLRHQCNFPSAPQSFSSNFLETDRAAIFQWKVITRNMPEMLKLFTERRAFSRILRR
eukprot:COSAG02_NODE_336_length_24344_cov_63.239101_5_plen_166_part_00